MNEALLEQRLKALEQAVGELQRQKSVNSSASWLERMTGCVTDTTALWEAYEAGRAYRMADRPDDESGDQP